MSSIVSKADLRSIVSLLAITTLIGLVIYVVIRSDMRITVSGTVDIANLFTVFLTIISVIIGWLFGRRETQ